MSILDRLDNTSSDNLSGKVAKESVDKFNNKYLFCLTYVLAEYELVDDVSNRLMNIFSNCLNVNEFFISKYKPFDDDFTINNTRHLNLWHVDVFFNYDYTSDADVLKFFNKMYLYTNLLSKTGYKMGQITPGVYSIILKRIDVNMEVTIHYINNISNLYGIFSANEESNKRVYDLLYILRGKESDNSKRTELEVRRIAWLNENSYELKHHYRTANGYQYEYNVEYNHLARQILPENKICVHNITINFNTAILKARTLRELSLRILLFKAFIDETKTDDGWNIYRDSNVISLLRNPANAYAFCLEGAYLKERRFNLTANLKDMRVMNDYVHYLYENNRIDEIKNINEAEQFIEMLTDFVNRVTIEDVQSFIKMRSTVNPQYNNIVI